MIIAVGLIISVCGAYLSWTIMAAEVPLLAAQHGAFPKVFRRQNKNHAPSASLWLTNGAVQIALVLIWFTSSNYNSLLTIASEMILVPYFLVGAFLFKVALQRNDKRLIAAASGACLYGIWLLYASGLMHLLMSVLLYAPGLLVFIYARRGHDEVKLLNKLERSSILLLLLATVPAGWFMLQ
ncbi:Putative arginine/ornithine antiporter [Serratia rubidaea]|uniref:Arginine/ornithine antiporter n=1 Tax=Serratia rubidaea TaxID=61652 RepID=A0A447QUF2_SERRU|nr:Putative arginine/ornithine antiporter [Serratia rubidaea]